MPIDYKKYVPEWQEIRKRILERDGHRCKECGIPDFVAVAHLDHDIRNNEEGNLATLCRPCHLSHDRYQHRTNQKETWRKKRDAIERTQTQDVPLA